MIYFYNIKIKTYWNDLKQPGFMCQIYDSGYETLITLQKASQNKL